MSSLPTEQGLETFFVLSPPKLPIECSLPTVPQAPLLCLALFSPFLQIPPLSLESLQLPSCVEEIKFVTAYILLQFIKKFMLSPASSGTEYLKKSFWNLERGEFYFFSLQCLVLTFQWVVFPTTIAETSIESPFGLSNAQLGLLTSLYIQL